MRFSNNYLRQAFISLAFFLLAAGSATAGTLFGSVSEIHDGDTITIICLKRPLDIHLIGVAAPEKEQPYSEVARQHLSDLILNKEVVVETSGLGENALIMGRVFLKEADVGAQMLRDGAAWYDRPYDSILTEDQRQMYAACETAARNERRGIWQDTNPLPPWEFRAGMRLPEPSRSSPVANTTAGRTPRPGLTSENVSPSFASTGPLPLGSSEAVALSSDSKWLRFTQPGGKVSMLVPGEGTRRSSKFLLEDGRVVSINTYLGRSERTTFLVVFSSGADAGESDAAILDSAVRGFIDGIKTDWKKLGTTFECYPELTRNIAVSGFVGRQYDLGGCTLPGKVRFYTRVVNNVREMYVTGAFFFGSSDDPKARRFFDSFAVSASAGSSVGRN